MWDTLPETRSSHLEIDAWKTIISFCGPACFQGRLLLVLGSVAPSFVGDDNSNSFFQFSPLCLFGEEKIHPFWRKKTHQQHQSCRVGRHLSRSRVTLSAAEVMRMIRASFVATPQEPSTWHPSGMWMRQMNSRQLQVVVLSPGREKTGTNPGRYRIDGKAPCSKHAILQGKYIIYPHQNRKRGNSLILSWNSPAGRGWHVSFGEDKILSKWASDAGESGEFWGWW